MTKPPDGGMYGIKLIWPDHLLYRELTEVRDGSDGKYPLMNFKISLKGQAANIPDGHQCLVYVVRGKTPNWMRFIWAIKFIGTLEDGDRALVAWGHPPGQALPGAMSEFPLHRPIRFLARIEPPENGPTPDQLRKSSGVEWRPYGPGFMYVPADRYQRLFDSITWTWRADRDATPAPPPPAPAFVNPPVPDPEALLRRIREVGGKPERNVEDVVKFFLTQLGHVERNIVFQIGRVDVLLSGAQGEALAVVEVKRALDSKTIDRARRQAFDYANQVGARLVIITDADVYVVYDRDRGTSYDSMNCGKFQLTRFSSEDEALLDLLRP
jgi:hypothetical protein